MCDGPADCIENGVIKDCYPTAVFSNETNFCECSPWFGWTGENCDEHTGQNVFYGIWVCFIALWALFVNIAIFRTLFYHFRYGKNASGIDPIIYTSGFIIVSNLLIFVNCMLSLSSAVDPTRFEITTYKGDDEEFVTIKGGKFSAFALVMAAGFIALAALQIFVSWQQIAVKASTFGTNRTKVMAESIMSGIKIFVIIFTIFLLTTAATDNIEVASLGVVIVAFLLAICYPFAYLSLRKAFLGLQVIGNDFVKRIIDLIGFCAKVNMISLLVSTLTIALFAALYDNYQERLTPGKFNYIVFFRDLGTISGLFQVTVMGWYINAVANRERYVGQTSRFWRRWDLQHVKLSSNKSESKDKKIATNTPVVSVKTNNVGTNTAFATEQNFHSTSALPPTSFNTVNI